MLNLPSLFLLSVCVYICCVCVCHVSEGAYGGQENGIGSPEAGVTHGCEWPDIENV